MSIYFKIHDLLNLIILCSILRLYFTLLLQLGECKVCFTSSLFSSLSCYFHCISLVAFSLVYHRLLDRCQLLRSKYPDRLSTKPCTYHHDEASGTWYDDTDSYETPKDDGLHKRTGRSRIDKAIHRAQELQLLEFIIVELLSNSITTWIPFHLL